MTPSLSIILPVRNIQYTLSRHVLRLLEVAPELTSRLELLIIDDNSTDFTADIAFELEREYPQVKLIKQSGKGFASGIEEGTKLATGEILIACEPGKIPGPGELRTMWQVRLEARQVMEQTKRPMTISDNLMQRLGTWGKGLEKSDKPAEMPKLAGETRVDESHDQARGTHTAPSFVAHLKNLIGGEESNCRSQLG